MKGSKRRKQKLVSNWQHSWRWFSVQAMVAAAALQGAWVTLPKDLLQHISDDVRTILVMAILVLGVVGRLIDQSGDP